MPIYEYNCPKCGEFETTQRITDPPLQKCPTCRRKVTKLISATSFQLKGGGWYVTDYGKSGAATPGKKAEATSDSGTTTTASTESKATTKDSKETKSSSKDTKAA